METLLCAIDVGTASARAGLFDLAGTLRAKAVRPLALPAPGSARGSYASGAIWEAVCGAVRDAVASARAAPGAVAGLGFDATCSLVCLDTDGAPLPVAEGGHDTIAWFDHRAGDQARRCTASGHAVIGRLGGAMSPEMQIPKLMWLKETRPDLWPRLGRAFDLADFLVWRATGSAARSACTLGAKWTWLADAGGWQADFLAAMGISDLAARAGLGGEVLSPGALAGRLSERAAAELGLIEGCPVAIGMVDAYAGALGALGGREAASERRMALVAGTSSCLMVVTREPIAGRGLWGPFRDAVLPGLWASEGGQSATGALLDMVLRAFGPGHRDGPEMHAAVEARLVELLAADPRLGAEIAVLPDMAGNRTPFADPGLRGAISGLGLVADFDGLCALYWRVAVSLALGLRQVLDHMEACGAAADCLRPAGGHVLSALLMQLYADATGRPVEVIAGGEAVLLGSAANAAAAAGLAPDAASAAARMAGAPLRVLPRPAWQGGYETDYAVFLAMQRHRAELDALRAGAAVDAGV